MTCAQPELRMKQRFVKQGYVKQGFVKQGLLCMAILALHVLLGTLAQADELDSQPVGTQPTPATGAAPATSTEPAVVTQATADGTEEKRESSEFELPAPPARLARLIERGKVEFEFYDPATNPREFDGETHFEFRVEYSFRYSFRIRSRDDAKFVFVNPSFNRIDILCQNHVFIPMRFQHDKFWQTKLVDHEFEHVRVNCDQRPRLLADYLLKRIDRFEISLGPDEDFDEQKIEEIIGSEVVKIRTEIIRIIQANNDYLDELTRHGLKDLEDPEAFFAELYSVANLKKENFIFLEDVANLIESEEFVAGE
jgi:hypothetical protein